jgi:hypothetical protein
LIPFDFGRPFFYRTSSITALQHLTKSPHLQHPKNQYQNAFLRRRRCLHGHLRCC